MGEMKQAAHTSSPLFYVSDGGPSRAYASLEEAMSDAEEQISIYRKDARLDGEWPSSVEDIAIYQCTVPTKEPDEDGICVAHSQSTVVSQSETGDDYYEFSMALRAALSKAEGRSLSSASGREGGE